MQRHEIKVIGLVSFSHFMTHSYMSILPAVLLAITAERGLSFTAIGLITNVGYFLYGLGSFPAGYLSDRIGSKRVLTVGLGGMAISSILVGLSQGLVAFAVAYALLGLFASIHHPAGLSLIARRVENRRGKAMGMHGVLGNVGMMLAPLVASLGLMIFRTWRAAYLIYGVLGLVSALISYRSRIEQEADLDWRSLYRWQELFRKCRRETAAAGAAAPVAGSAGEKSVPAKFPLSLFLLFCVAVLSGFIFRGSLTFFPALLQREVYFISSSEAPAVLAGTITSLILSLGLIGAWFGGWINDKIKRPELVPIVIFVLIAPVLFLISKFSDSKLLVMSCLFSLIYYAWQPSHNYLISRYTRRASHGVGFGINFFLLFGVGSVAMAIGGYVADDYSVDRFYLVMAGISALALAVAAGVYLLRRWSVEFPFKLVRESSVDK
ncbi:MAG: MFS transporter [Desulfobulbaceae bacterium]|nr:MFS transporter [Desulfobulbaceae bacterium]